LGNGVTVARLALNQLV